MSTLGTLHETKEEFRVDLEEIIDVLEDQSTPKIQNQQIPAQGA